MTTPLQPMKSDKPPTAKERFLAWVAIQLTEVEPVDHKWLAELLHSAYQRGRRDGQVGLINGLKALVRNYDVMRTRNTKEQAPASVYRAALVKPTVQGEPQSQEDHERFEGPYYGPKD